MNSDRCSFLFKLWAINNTVCFPILPVTSMATCWQRFEWPSACPRSSSTQTASCRTCWGQGSPQPCTGNPSRFRSLGRSSASSYWVVQVCAHQLTACVQWEWCKVFRGVCRALSNGLHTAHGTYCLFCLLGASGKSFYAIGDDMIGKWQCQRPKMVP